MINILVTVSAHRVWSGSSVQNNTE